MQEMIYIDLWFEGIKHHCEKGVAEFMAPETRD